MMASDTFADKGGPVKQVRQMGGTTVVSLTGDIDLYCSPAVRNVLTEVTVNRPASVVIDASEVPHMDSSGVATMVEALQRIRRYNGRLVLVGLQARVRSVFEIAKLTDLFEIKAELAEVLGDGKE